MRNASSNSTPAARSVRSVGAFLPISNLEIIYPAIMVPQVSSDCICTDVTIINRSETEYFFGAEVAIAGSTKLLPVASYDHDISASSAGPIGSGATFDLYRHERYLFHSNITQSLEAEMGAYPARPTSHHTATIDVEIIVDADQH